MIHKIITYCLLITTAFVFGQTEDIALKGSLAPNFTVRQKDASVQLSDLKGKVVLVNFFATWCGPCMKELPLLQKTIWDKYKDNPNFNLIIIGRGHTAEEMDTFKASKKYTMPFYPDFDKSIYNLYASKYIPRNYLIDKNGVIVYTSMGFTREDFEKLTEEVDKLMKDN